MSKIAKAKTAKSAKSKWPVEVRESPRHGKGLFATRKIKADDLVIPIEGKPATEDGMYILWWVNDAGDDEGMEVTNDAKYVNHSSTANAGYFDEGVFALRDIEPGEEITHYYGEGWSDVE